MPAQPSAARQLIARHIPQTFWFARAFLRWRVPSERQAANDDIRSSILELPGHFVNDIKLDRRRKNVSELENRVGELLRRTKMTTKSRYRASERLERHHKFSQWTVSLISAALVFVPMMQVFKIELGVDALYLSATQAVLAVLVLVYSLLLGQENFISRAEAMHRNGVELGRFARRLAGINGDVEDAKYAELTEEYYDILEKYSNHKPIDYLFTKLAETPKTPGAWIGYVWMWIQARAITIFIFSHYFLAMAFVAYIFAHFFMAIKVNFPK